MSLNPQPSYPAQGGYVLKLHRDARPQHGQLRGRLEHIASGATTDFDSAAALVEWLARHAAALAADTTTRSTEA
jgi:hypothetical protein